MKKRSSLGSDYGFVGNLHHHTNVGTIKIQRIEPERNATFSGRELKFVQVPWSDDLAIIYRHGGVAPRATPYSIPRSNHVASETVKKRTHGHAPLISN